MSRYFDVFIVPSSADEKRIYVGGIEAKGTSELLSELKGLLEESQALEDWIHWGDGALSVELFVPEQKGSSPAPSRAHGRKAVHPQPQLEGSGV